MTKAESKTKVAILGGGMAAIAAAFELTARPELRQKYEVTIYQQGWRLGGKGASGRNMARQDRIEEHGLHIWMGFYENAFRMMRACYEEVDRAPHTPLATWQDAFKPSEWIVLTEKYNGRWVDWPIKVPTNKATPGDGKLLGSFWNYVYEFLEWMRELLEDLLATRPGLFVQPTTAQPTPWQKPPWWDHLVDEIAPELDKIELAAGLGSFRMAHQLARLRHLFPEKHTSEAHHRILCTLLNDFKTWLWEHVVKRHLDDDKLRFFFVLFDMASAMVCGIIEDELLTRGFHSVDNEELRGWLGRHGAQADPTLQENPMLRLMYDLVFAYEDGDVTKPNLAAGTAISGMLRIAFTYKGALYWKMQAGMGDTVFAPFYEVLKRRGVHFKFFHCVTKVGVSPASEATKYVTTVEMIPQVPLTVAEYDPLILVKELPCWPSEPLWNQLERGDDLREQEINFEYECNPLAVAPITLHKDQDFDIVILGISLAALPAICSDIMAQNPKWRQMVTQIKTVMTQAFQLWVNHDLAELGWAYAPGSLFGPYVEPLDTYADMSHLITHENWPDNYYLQAIAYVCGVLRNIPHYTQADATAQAYRNAIEFLNHDIKGLWPKASQSSSHQAIKWDVLIDPEDRQGEERFQAQYWRANFQPSERYVLSVAGSNGYRLRADESGYHNLFLAGDWTNNGLNAGHIEAATMSGMQAARAICGYPVEIIGEKDPWL